MKNIISFVSVKDMKERHNAVSCADLLQVYMRSCQATGPSEKILFEGVGHRDVYNITAPFMSGGRRILSGRVESRATELSEIIFFNKRGDTAWEPVADAPTFGLQDPCITLIDGQLILGGVRFPVELPGGGKSWRMEFYSGSSLNSLKAMFQGPDKMKDIRLGAMADGRVAVLTRSQGVKGGRGKIGFCIAASPDAITADLIEAAPSIEGQFIPEEWGGANEAHLLKNGLLGILGHIACFDSGGGRHYYPMSFVLDPVKKTTSPVRIIARRSDFPAGAAKRPDLADVVFSGGLVRNGAGWATLYSGLGDAEAGWLKIPDPFATFEA